MTTDMIPWGPTGQLVYERTYSRTKPNGQKETWPETVARVVDGNLSLTDQRHHWTNERERLHSRIENFEILPAGRHLWASGVRGRQYLFNCHVAGWHEDITEHFSFTFLRLMEGGGVGANYSNRFLQQYAELYGPYSMHVVCDPEHPDYEKMQEAGVLSPEYNSDWEGSFEVEDSREGWAAALVDLIGTYDRDAKNTNRVFDVSRVRAEGTRLKTFGGRASGPLPLAVMLNEVTEILNRENGEGFLTGMAAMEIDHAVARCVVSGGNRRSARMSIMNWDDPQIEQFIHCKSDQGKHWTTNISVEIDRNFFAALAYGSRHAESVLADVAEGMLHNGEPGIWNSELSNVGEPNEVTATNPCGEIPLEPWENCNLGHVNLAAFVDANGNIDHEGLIDAHQLMTRFLIRATYGDVNDDKQAEILARNRRIGVGHFGLASFLAKRGISYHAAPQHRGVVVLLHELAEEVDFEAMRFCHHLRIPVPVKTRTVAPTGTIAKMPGVSEGIHPIFAKYFLRRIRFSALDPDQVRTVTDYARNGYKIEACQYAPNTWVVEIPTKDALLPEVAAARGEQQAEDIIQSAGELTLDDMLSVQALYQARWADNAVSYTANIDAQSYTVAEVMRHLREYAPTVKGFTIFPETGMPQAPYERISKEQYERYTTTEVADSIDENCLSGACPVR